MLQHGWQVEGRLEDVGLAAWLLWPDRDEMSIAAVQVIKLLDMVDGWACSV